MRRLSGRSLALAVLLPAMVGAQAPAPRPFKVVKLDPALDAIISTDAKIEILGEHFGLTWGFKTPPAAIFCSATAPRT